MDFYIKKVFDKKIDDLTHLQFQKYSRGEFKNKAMIVAKYSSGFYRINTTPEYGNEFVRYFAEKLSGNKSRVTGVIVSTRDLTGELEFQNKKQFMGVKMYEINKDMTGNEILELCDKLPNSFLGLSFNVNDNELKIKPKAPKSAKPSTKADSPKVDFCKIKTSDKELVNNLIFDNEAKGFKNIEISHDFMINEIKIDENLKKEAGDDYKLIKEKAKRKGKLIRKLVVDGKEIIREKEFEA